MRASARKAAAGNGGEVRGGQPRAMLASATEAELPRRASHLRPRRGQSWPPDHWKRGRANGTASFLSKRLQNHSISRGRAPCLIRLPAVPHRGDTGLIGAVPPSPRNRAPRSRSSPGEAGWRSCCWSADGCHSGFPGSCTPFGRGPAFPAVSPPPAPRFRSRITSRRWSAPMGSSSPGSRRRRPGSCKPQRGSASVAGRRCGCPSGKSCGGFSLFVTSFPISQIDILYSVGYDGRVTETPRPFKRRSAVR